MHFCYMKTGKRNVKFSVKISSYLLDFCPIIGKMFISQRHSVLLLEAVIFSI